MKCQEIKENATEGMKEELKKFGYRMKFPAKTGDLSRRWCSAYLKIMVADSVISNLSRLGELEEISRKRQKTKKAKGGCMEGAVQSSVTSNSEKISKNTKILIVSGERRGEQNITKWKFTVQMQKNDLTELFISGGL